MIVVVAAAAAAAAFMSPPSSIEDLRWRGTSHMHIHDSSSSRTLSKHTHTHAGAYPYTYTHVHVLTSALTRASSNPTTTNRAHFILEREGTGSTIGQWKITITLPIWEYVVASFDLASTSRFCHCQFLQLSHSKRTVSDKQINHCSVIRMPDTINTTITILHTKDT